MRRPRYIEFDCRMCGAFHERFCETNDDNSPLEPEVCGATTFHDGYEELQVNTPCSEVLVAREIALSSSPLVAPLAGKDVKTNLDDAARQRERLEKRSSEHFFKKGGRDEAVERERAMLKKNGMEGAGGVW